VTAWTERLSARTTAALAAALAVSAALLGYTVGASTDDVFEDVGTAHSVEGQISIQIDDWTYAVPLDVPWTDRNGSHHQGGRPECLSPSDAPLPDVRFAAVPVEVRGSGFRQVVTVFCDER
jgi:hypothetical protein